MHLQDNWSGEIKLFWEAAGPYTIANGEHVGGRSVGGCSSGGDGGGVEGLGGSGRDVSGCYASSYRTGLYYFFLQSNYS